VVLNCIIIAMKNINDLNDIIEIKDSKIDVGHIVEEIKKEIGKRKLAYLKELNQNLPNIIDVAQDSEYLLDGWYESDIIGGQRARWTQKQFSFLLNSGDGSYVNLQLVSTPPDVDKYSLNMNLYVSDKLISKKKITRIGGQVLSFSLPRNLKNNNLRIKIELSRTFCPAQITKGGDMRQLGIGVSKISNTLMSETGSKYLAELAGYETTIFTQAERVRLHANPESFLPKDTKLKFFKSLVLRIIRVYTSVQTTFNYYVAELFKNVAEQNRTLAKYVADIDNKLTSTNETVERLDQYTPLYWDEHQDAFYKFHQANLRGDEKTVKNLLSVYLKFLNKPTFYTKRPFVDIGSGRGEFLGLLKEKNVNAVGVDINIEFVKIAAKRKLKVINSDAISYLTALDAGSVGGVSAFHLVEHFTFPQLFDFIFLVREKLVKGGILILETPNPDNIVVATEHFYNDYTHKTKLPPILLSKLCEYIGFKDIRIIPLHPEQKGKLSKQDFRFYGPMDYALIAKK